MKADRALLCSNNRRLPAASWTRPSHPLPVLPRRTARNSTVNEPEAASTSDEVLIRFFVDWATRRPTLADNGGWPQQAPLVPHLRSRASFLTCLSNISANIDIFIFIRTCICSVLLCVLCCAVLYCTVLCCTVLCFIVWYCIVLYYAVPYCTALSFHFPSFTLSCAVLTGLCCAVSFCSAI